MSNSGQPHRRQPTRLPHPWDSPGKNTGVGCHFLLQCMKVKSESEAAQSCPTLSDPMDCSPPGSSIHGIFQAGVLEWGVIAFSTLVIRKRQIKTIMRYHFTLTGWSGFFLFKQKTSSGNYIKKLRPLYITVGNVKWCSHFGKQLVSSSKT